MDSTAQTPPTPTPPPATIKHCTQCGHPMAGRHTAPKLGIRRHQGNGVCANCARANRSDRAKYPTQLDTPLDVSWRERGLCRGADPRPFDDDLILQPRGRLVPGNARTPRVPQETKNAAIRYCLPCPVRRPCLRAAEQDRGTGLRGGVFRIWVADQLLSVDLLDAAWIENVA